MSEANAKKYGLVDDTGRKYHYSWTYGFEFGDGRTDKTPIIPIDTKIRDPQNGNDKSAYSTSTWMSVGKRGCMTLFGRMLAMQYNMVYDCRENTMTTNWEGDDIKDSEIKQLCLQPLPDMSPSKRKSKQIEWVAFKQLKNICKGRYPQKLRLHLNKATNNKGKKKGKQKTLATKSATKGIRYPVFRAEMPFC